MMIPLPLITLIVASIVTAVIVLALFRRPKQATIEYDDWRFEPAPDITAHELATILQHLQVYYVADFRFIAFPKGTTPSTVLGAAAARHFIFMGNTRP